MTIKYNKNGRKLPTVFICPSCGEKSVRVKGLKKSDEATVKCGSCGLEKKVSVHIYSKPVDVFGDFVDIYHATKELKRLTKRAEKLKKEGDLKELAYIYSMLSDICKIKANELMHKGEAEKWEREARRYSRLEEKTLNGEDFVAQGCGEETEETDGADLIKDRDIDDVFDDPGYLEW